MALADFTAELIELNYLPSERDNGFVVFDYEVPIGPLAGRVVKLGLKPEGDWPVTPPGGPRVSPRILPINPDGQLGHPLGAVHEAPELGPDWEYWSRPCSHWAQTDRTAAAYLSHVHHLFETLPHDLA
jgi:hypothetical protein